MSVQGPAPLRAEPKGESIVEGNQTVVIEVGLGDLVDEQLSVSRRRLRFRSNGGR